MSDDQKLCPFSKPIIGKWCDCQYARLSDRCAGKMICKQDQSQRPVCQQLVLQLEKNTRFILGMSDLNQPLTHQQYMKIKCGGIQAIHHVLELNSNQLPRLTEITQKIIQRYGALADFPYREIVRDIANFSHRKATRKNVKLPL